MNELHSKVLPATKIFVPRFTVQVESWGYPAGVNGATVWPRR